MSNISKPLPTQARLQERLSYDAESGALTWLFDPNGIRGWNAKFAGTVAGARGVRGYRYVYLDGSSYRASRLIWMLVHGVDPREMFIDHINGNRSDDRIANLRMATQAQNSRNAKTYKKKSNLPKGVKKNNRRYAARITINKKVIWLGNFPTPELAHAAYVVAAREWHKEFARAA